MLETKDHPSTAFEQINWFILLNMNYIFYEREYIGDLVVKQGHKAWVPRYRGLQITGWF